MKSYVVDTHALMWYLTGDRRLGSQAEAVLNDPDVTLIIPAIVLAEIKDLAHKGRFGQTLGDVLAVIGWKAFARPRPMQVNWMGLGRFVVKVPAGRAMAAVAGVGYTSRYGSKRS